MLWDVHSTGPMRASKRSPAALLVGTRDTRPGQRTHSHILPRKSSTAQASRGRSEQLNDRSPKYASALPWLCRAYSLAEMLAAPPSSAGGGLWG